MKLHPIELPNSSSDLTITTNACDLRRDLHLFVAYTRERLVKRSHRHNSLSKTDATRLAKRMSDPDALSAVKADGESVWVDCVDSTALTLGFVDYDTEGIYQGYSSAEPSYPDNNIEYQQEAYEQFLALSLQAQEQRIVDALVDEFSYGYNEFFSRSLFGKLDHFDQRGCATGVMPTLDFAKARRLLLDCLSVRQADCWYATTDLIRELKAHHPFFLIPRTLPTQLRGGSRQRYGNFYEHRGDRWSNKQTVPDDATDTFERVEGRYVERFLEHIPLILGYVDVAHGQPDDPELFPELGRLKAFRVKPRFLRFMQDRIAPPKVTVQPNFEIQIESEAYPARLMKTLTRIAEVLSEDTVTVVKLNKKKISLQLLEDESLDVVRLLSALSDKPIPANVVTELEEWAGHTDVFTLYDGFGLVEGETDPSAVQDATTQRISRTLHIVTSPAIVFKRLEKAKLAPIRVTHADNALRALPKSADTVFAKLSAQTAAKKSRPKIAVQRQVRVTWQLPSSEVLEHFRESLSAARCPLDVDPRRRTISFAQSHERQLKTIVKSLKDTYLIRFEDTDDA